MGHHALSASAAWKVIATLLDDERVDFLAEPSGIDGTLPGLLTYPIPTPKLVSDAYLAAFAICTSRRLVTLDSGFRQFRGLHTDLLGQ